MSDLSWVDELMAGIDKTETDSDKGWWETSVGAKFGKKKLAKLKKLISERERLAKDEILDDLLEWHDYWIRVHGEPFNWYGAVKALKVAKDHQKPFTTLKQLSKQNSQKEKGIT